MMRCEDKCRPKRLRDKQLRGVGNLANQQPPVAILKWYPFPGIDLCTAFDAEVCLSRSAIRSSQLIVRNLSTCAVQVSLAINESCSTHSSPRNSRSSRHPTLCFIPLLRCIRARRLPLGRKQSLNPSFIARENLTAFQRVPTCTEYRK